MSATHLRSGGEYLWEAVLGMTSTCFGRNLHDVLPFYGFMNEDDSAARDVLGNRTAEDPGAAFAGGDGQGEAQSEEPQGMDAGLSGSPDGTASGDAPKRLWVERAMPRLLRSALHSPATCDHRRRG